MTQELVIALSKNALWTTLLVAAPILIFGLVTGLAIGIFQAVTQIQELTLTFVPKILVVMIALALFLPWMLNTLIAFTMNVFGLIPSVAQ